MIISQLDIPSRAVSILESKGIKSLYPTQEQAIRAGVLKGANIVLSSPTASGKTLVAIITILKHVLEGKGIALYLTPLRALAAEKYEELRDLGSSLGFKVALTTGDYDSSDPWLEDYDVIVTTNEKADSLVRHRASWLSKVSLVVVDEVHLLGLDRRGPVLEMLIARLKRFKKDVQILALSATIRNIEELASWLKAKPVVSDWRPVRLKEGVYYDGAIYFDSGEVVEIESRGDPLIDLTINGLGNRGQVLIFASTRAKALHYAKKLAPKVYTTLKQSKKGALIESSHTLLKIERNNIVEKLANFLSMGVAFHHAGLSYNVRRYIEKLFKDNVIKVIVATPTLAAGVNLPARRVILADYRRFNVEIGRYEMIPVMEYKQMAGRAGRPQYDRYGEAILIAKTADELELLMEEYVNAIPEKIISKLASEPVLRGQLLASIASGFAEDEESVINLMSDTLFATQFDISSISPVLKDALDFLVKEELIEKLNGKLRATDIGKRVAELYLSPQSAVIIVKGLLEKERSNSIGYLHLIASTPDMPKLYLRRGERKTLLQLLYEIEDELILEPPYDPEELEFFLAELKTALVLEDWINEVRDDEIYEKYGIGPGDLYSLTQTAEWLLYSAYELAKLKGLTHHLLPLLSLRKRVKHGVKEELLELVRIKGIGRVRARILFNAGFKGLEEIAKADISRLASLPLIGTSLAKRLKETVIKGVLDLEGELKEEGNEITLDQYF